MVGLACDIDKNHLYNLTCFIKAVRGKQGLLNISWSWKNMPKNDTWLKVVLKYRNSKGRLLPYLIDIDFDVCTIKTGEGSTLPLLALAIINFLGNMAKAPFVTEGCPLIPKF